MDYIRMKNKQLLEEGHTGRQRVRLVCGMKYGREAWAVETTEAREQPRYAFFRTSQIPPFLNGLSELLEDVESDRHEEREGEVVTTIPSGIGHDLYFHWERSRYHLYAYIQREADFYGSYALTFRVHEIGPLFEWFYAAVKRWEPQMLKATKVVARAPIPTGVCGWSNPTRHLFTVGQHDPLLGLGRIRFGAPRKEDC